MRLIFTLLFIISFAQINGQDTTIITYRMASADTINASFKGDTIITTLRMAQIDTLNATYKLNDEIVINKKKIITNTLLNAGVIVGSMFVLNNVWYSNYKRSSFHSFNDSKEWLQIDKIGHSWSAYQLGRCSFESWKGTGLSRKKQIWYGGAAGAAYLTTIEVLDGLSEEWGWSWSDVAANIFGSGLFIGQQLGWNEQRIGLKFSFHAKSYDNALLNNRRNALFGKTWTQQILKEYNGQTFWLSANVKSFLPNTKLPKWLNIAIGYGAEGLFGANDNLVKDANGNITFDARNIPRKRQWYFAPDVDFSKIKTKSKVLKTLFFIMNGIKIPAPTLEIGNGKLRLRPIYF